MDEIFEMGTATTAEKAYDVILELFENIEPSQAWVDEFNKAAMAMENRSDDGIDDVLPTTNHVLPWVAWMENDKPYIASPPIIIKDSQFRLTLDVMHPLNGNHINVHAIPCSPTGKMLDKMSNANTACITIDSGAGPAMIFAGWDYVAREGIEEALKSGAILHSWVQVVTDKIPCVDATTAQEMHSVKMLGVYADDKNLERASLEYRKVFKGKGWESMRAAVKYNKLRFYLGIECNGTEIEFEQVHKNEGWMGKKEFKKWLLDGVQITRDTILDFARDVEKEVFGTKKVAVIARKIRSMNITTIVNARMPGDGLPNQIIPWEFTYTTAVPVKPDSSTNRTSAIREALLKIGRSDGFDGLKFKDVNGVVCLELLVGSKLKPGIPYEYSVFKGCLVDVVNTRSAVFEYESCLKF